MKRFLQNLTTPASALAHERTSRFALPTGYLRPKTDVLQRGSTSAKRRRRTLSAKIDVNSLKFLPKNTECLRSSVVRPSAILQLEPDPERRCKALPRQMMVTLLLVLAMHWCSLESALAVATQSGRVRDRIESSPSQDENLIQKMAILARAQPERRRVGPEVTGES